jgi:hypothetical protein
MERDQLHSEHYFPVGLAEARAYFGVGNRVMESRFGPQNSLGKIADLIAELMMEKSTAGRIDLRDTALDFLQDSLF